MAVNKLFWSAKLMTDQWEADAAKLLRARGYNANLTGLGDDKSLNIWTTSVEPYVLTISNGRGGGVVLEEDGYEILLAVMLLGKEFGLLLSNDGGDQIDPARLREGMEHLSFPNILFTEIEAKAIAIGLAQPRMRLEQFAPAVSLFSI